jgi:hypothetical protein
VSERDVTLNLGVGGILRDWSGRGSWGADLAQGRVPEEMTAERGGSESTADFQDAAPADALAI